MKAQPKITLIGAGGMSFGPVMVLDAINSPKLRGAQMMLHDINPQKLDVVYDLAQRLNREHGNPIRLERSLDPAAALSGASLRSAPNGPTVATRREPLPRDVRRVDGAAG